MNINPEYIQKKEFHTTFKGYNMEEVDKFLDVIAIEFDRLFKKNKELQENLDRIKFENPSQEEDISKLVSDVLVSAHKVADEIKKKAELDAKEIIEQKKSVEENEISGLLSRKQDIEEKIQILDNYYKNLVSKIKNILNDFDLKLSEMDKDFMIDKGVTDIRTDANKMVGNKSIEEQIAGDKAKNQNLEEEAESEVDKKLREFIEENNQSIDIGHNKEKDEQKGNYGFKEEENISREKKKLDIANPDIINEFFSDDEKRSY